MINNQSIQGQAPLEPDMQIALSPQGPRFRFIGGGRLAEIDESFDKPFTDGQVDIPPSADETSLSARNRQNPERNSKKHKSRGLFKRFFSS